ncbi:MAG: hypothetical protein WCC12_00525, partial [Anaerolineales bacterium]
MAAGIFLSERVTMYSERDFRDSILHQGLRDCFLKTLWDTDTTDLPCGYDVTEFHGKNRNKKAPFRGFRE